MPKEKILVVDDQPYILDLLSDFLFKEGYQVVLAESGEKAAEIVKADSIHLALIDLCNQLLFPYTYLSIFLLFQNVFLIH